MVIGRISLAMFVRISTQIKSHYGYVQGSATFYSKLIANWLVTVKRLFDKSIVSITFKGVFHSIIIIDEF